MNQKRKGMTLVELAIVVMVVGFLISILGVNAVRLFRPTVKDISEKVKATLQYCYSNAIIHNYTVIFDIDLEEKKYTAYKVIRKDSGLEEKKMMEVKLPAYNYIVDVTDIRGIKYTNGHVRIPFTHSGISEDYNIHLGTESTIKKTILVYRYGGKITIKDGTINRTSGAGSATDKTQETQFEDF